MAQLIKRDHTTTLGTHEVWRTQGGQTYLNNVDVVISHPNQEIKQWHLLKHEHADFICDTEWNNKTDLIQALHTCGITDISPSDSVGIEDGEMSHIHYFQ